MARGARVRQKRRLPNSLARDCHSTLRPHPLTPPNLRAYAAARLALAALAAHALTRFLASYALALRCRAIPAIVTSVEIGRTVRLRSRVQSDLGAVPSPGAIQSN
jgi:hypothetical protein